MQNDQRTADALLAARLYYQDDLKTEAIARELGVSRSTVSRLLSYAREQGLVEIKIHDPQQEPHELQQKIVRQFGIVKAAVVPVPTSASERDWLDRVALYTAKYLNTIFDNDMVLGIAWGTTISAISRHLIPKITVNSAIVQLNGAGNTQTLGITYASEIITRFANNYRARMQLFPVPTFFDYADTKRALVRERSIQRILALQEETNILLYSIGAVNAGVPSHVYSGGYLEAADYAALEAEHVIGDIATVFFRSDGTYDGIELNERASGPNLDLFHDRYRRRICVVSGLGKVRGLHAALRGGLLSELIVDEPTARALLQFAASYYRRH